MYVRDVKSCWLLAGALILGGCAATHDDGGRVDLSEDMPAHATSVIEIEDGALSRDFFGHFALTIGPEDGGRLEATGFDAEGNSLRVGVPVSTSSLARTADGSWVLSVQPEAGFDWLFEQPGSVVTNLPDAESGYYVNGLLMTATNDNQLDGWISLIPRSRIDFASHAVADGPEVRMNVRGMLIVNCRARDTNGRVVHDPTGLSSPLCAPHIVGY